MKTLRTFALLCIIALLSATNAFSQKTSFSYELPLTLTPTQCECLSEEISGSVVFEVSYTDKWWHEKGHGILIGSSSGDEYTLDHSSNMQFIFNSNVTVIGWPWTRLLRREGKLIAVLHESVRFVAPENNPNGPIIVDRFIQRVDCK